MRKWLKELVDNQYLPAIAALPDSSLGCSEAECWAKLMKRNCQDSVFEVEQNAGS